MTQIVHILIYIISGILIALGLAGSILCGNLIKKILSLGILQTAVLIIYIAIGFIDNSSIPIIKASEAVYSSPLNHVLMLTAIVVGVATLSLGLSIIVKIWNKFSSIEENDLDKYD